MPAIDILKQNRDLDGFTDLVMTGFPDGFLYNDSLRPFLKGFLGVYQDFLFQIESAANSLFTVDADNIFLDEFKVMYGLPNVLFPDVTTTSDAVFAISMMKLSQTLLSKEDYENFMALLGIKVKFYSLNQAILENSSFDYGFPITFSYSINKKDKLTYWIHVEDSEGFSGDYNGIGDAFDLDFVASNNNIQNAKNILDFLKPDYLIFEYITTYTKNLYGL